MKTILILLLLAGIARAEVVRMAADFSIPGPGNKAQTLRSMRGQPVVLIIAESPKTKALKKQLGWLRDIYQAFASRKAVFVAAIRNGDGTPLPSNIPFALANNPAGVAGAYGATGDFSLIIIGEDGNVDYQTNVPRTPERIRDVIQNSFAVQAASRKSERARDVKKPEAQ